jgi:hypothetical protein
MNKFEDNFLNNTTWTKTDIFLLGYSVFINLLTMGLIIYIIL